MFVAGVVTLVFFVLIFLTQIQSRKFEKEFVIWLCLGIVLVMRVGYVFVINQMWNVGLILYRFLRSQESIRRWEITGIYLLLRI